MRKENYNPGDWRIEPNKSWSLGKYLWQRGHTNSFITNAFFRQICHVYIFSEVATCRLVWFFWGDFFLWFMALFEMKKVAFLDPCANPKPKGKLLQQSNNLECACLLTDKLTNNLQVEAAANTSQAFPDSTMSGCHQTKSIVVLIDVITQTRPCQVTFVLGQVCNQSHTGTLQWCR